MVESANGRRRAGHITCQPVPRFEGTSAEQEQQGTLRRCDVQIEAIRESGRMHGSWRRQTRRSLGQPLPNPASPPASPSIGNYASLHLAVPFLRGNASMLEARLPTA